MASKELRNERLVPPAAILVLSLILATSNLLIQPARAQSDYDVTILDLSFDPQVLCVEKDDTVSWTNNDSLIYTLWFVFAENKSTYMLSSPIPPEESWSHTLTERGELLYYSLKHLWITGKLRVYTIFGDIDGDGDVDPFDFSAFRVAYGSKGPPQVPTPEPNYNPWADFDGDGDVDPFDFSTFRVNYGRTIVDP